MKVGAFLDMPRRHNPSIRRKQVSNSKIYRLFKQNTEAFGYIYGEIIETNLFNT